MGDRPVILMTIKSTFNNSGHELEMLLVNRPLDQVYDIFGVQGCK